MVEDLGREAAQATEEANQEGDAKENNQEEEEDGDGKENNAKREAMELWHKLIARPRTDPPQKHFSKHPPQRYEDDAPPIQLSMGANPRLWKLDWRHVDFMNLLIRHRAVQFDFDTLQDTNRTYGGRRCNWIEMMHDRSIAARRQAEGVLKEKGREKHGGNWRQWPLVTRCHRSRSLGANTR